MARPIASDVREVARAAASSAGATGIALRAVASLLRGGAIALRAVASSLRGGGDSATGGSGLATASGDSATGGSGLATRRGGSATAVASSLRGRGDSATGGSELATGRGDSATGGSELATRRGASATGGSCHPSPSEPAPHVQVRAPPFGWGARGGAAALPPVTPYARTAAAEPGAKRRAERGPWSPGPSTTECPQRSGGRSEAHGPRVT